MGADVTPMAADGKFLLLDWNELENSAGAGRKRTSLPKQET